MVVSTVGIDFEISDNVKIKQLDRIGRVISIWIMKYGTQYEVRYFDNAEVKTVYFFAEELERIQ